MAKTKKPQPTEVRADFLTRFQQKGVVPMAERPLSVRLPADLDARLRSLPNRTEWLRNAILEKMQRELDEQDWQVTEAE